MFRSLLSCRTYHELVSSASRRQKGLADVVRPCTTNLSGLAERTRSVIDTNATARRGFLSLATSPPSRTQIPSCHHLQSRYNNDSGVVAATAVVRRPHQQSKSAKRYLHLHEYQSLSLMKQAGLTTQNGGVARTPEEARIVAQRLLVASPNCDLIVKAQIHAGGRGKGHFTNGFKGM